ncbi:MAG: hypothetical protein Q8R67_14590 [Rhodoferax sp.]|nr:hypothetical protein [Rhodoferax sp.]MDP3652903.1 hypothetical protein [Rhodoferax sp.]
MAATTPNSPKIFASRQQVTAALKRASERARVLAEQTGTKLIVVPASQQAPDNAPLTTPDTPKVR